MEGEDPEFLSGDDETTMEDIDEEGMIDLFEQEIQKELSQSGGRKQMESKNLASLLNRPPSSSTPPYGHSRVKNERSSTGSSFLEASLTGSRRSNSLLESALGPPVTSSTPLQLQLYGSQAFQNSNYAKNQLQQHQQQMTFASTSMSGIKNEPQVSSSIDDAMDDYIPSHFLQVILIENEDQSVSQSGDSEAGMSLVSKNSALRTQLMASHTVSKKEVEVVQVEEEILPDLTTPFTPKEIHVCDLCQGSFLSAVLFARHKQDHPRVVSEEEEEEKSRKNLSVIQPLVMTGLTPRKTTSLLAVVHPTKNEDTSIKEENDNSFSEEEEAEDTNVSEKTSLDDEMETQE